MMNVRGLLTLNAVLVVLVALTALFTPTFLLELNGLEITQYTIAQMRVFGAVTIGVGVMSWLLRTEPPSPARRAFLIGAGVNYIVFAVVNVINLTSIFGFELRIGWFIFLLNVILGTAFFVFAYKEPLQR